MAADSSSSYHHGSSSDLSMPSYSLRENRNGELISLTKEKVHWPLRPPTGKYSTLEFKKSRRRRRQQAKLSVKSVSSDVIDPADQEKSIFSAFLKNSDSEHVPSERSSSFTHKDLTETASSRILTPTRQKETYAILGQASRVAVLEKLDDHMTTILFEDDSSKKLQLALLYEQKKFILHVVEMRNETTTWGLANRGELPEVSFFSLVKLVKFYSVHPLAAFLHL